MLLEMLTTDHQLKNVGPLATLLTTTAVAGDLFNHGKDNISRIGQTRNTNQPPTNALKTQTTIPPTTTTLERAAASAAVALNVKTAAAARTITTPGKVRWMSMTAHTALHSAPHNSKPFYQTILHHSNPYRTVHLTAHQALQSAAKYLAALQFFTSRHLEHLSNLRISLHPVVKAPLHLHLSWSARPPTTTISLISNTIYNCICSTLSSQSLFYYCFRSKHFKQDFTALQFVLLRCCSI